MSASDGINCFKVFFFFFCFLIFLQYIDSNMAHIFYEGCTIRQPEASLGFLCRNIILGSLASLANPHGYFKIKYIFALMCILVEEHWHEELARARINPADLKVLTQHDEEHQQRSDISGWRRRSSKETDFNKERDKWCMKPNKEIMNHDGKKIHIKNILLRYEIIPGAAPDSWLWNESTDRFVMSLRSVVLLCNRRCSDVFIV